MRLIQLARSLGVTQNQIIDFLSDQEIGGNKNGNTKISEAQVSLIVNHFGPKEENEPENEIDTAEAAPDSKEVKNETEMEPDQEIAPALPDSPTGESDETKDPQEQNEPQEEVQDTIEVIRAKKIKLEGIKVVGKIDLPEPVKKNEEKEADTPEDKQSQPPMRKKYSQKQRGHDSKNRGISKRKKTETYEQKIKREEKEALKKKRIREKKIKQKKKLHYEKQVKTNLQQKPKKKAAKKVPAPDPAPKKVVKKHKNPIRRFWAWLNGA